MWGLMEPGVGFADTSSTRVMWRGLRWSLVWCRPGKPPVPPSHPCMLAGEKLWLPHRTPLVQTAPGACEAVGGASGPSTRGPHHRRPRVGPASISSDQGADGPCVSTSLASSVTLCCLCWCHPW